MTHVQSCLLVQCQLDTGAVIGENVSLITGCRRVVLGSVRKQAEPTMKSSPVSSTPAISRMASASTPPPCSCPV